MPNHLHGIILLTDNPNADFHNTNVRAVRHPPNSDFHNTDVGAVREPPNAVPPQTRKPLGRLIGAFKTTSTTLINRLQKTEGAQFWQRDFHDRIIRNKRELEAIRAYIYNNPAAWDADRLHPNAPPNRFNAHWQRKSP